MNQDWILRRCSREKIASPPTTATTTSIQSFFNFRKQVDQASFLNQDWKIRRYSRCTRKDRSRLHHFSYQCSRTRGSLFHDLASRASKASIDYESILNVEEMPKYKGHITPKQLLLLLGSLSSKPAAGAQKEHFLVATSCSSCIHHSVKNKHAMAI